MDNATIYHQEFNRLVEKFVTELEQVRDLYADGIEEKGDPLIFARSTFSLARTVFSGLEGYRNPMLIR